MKKELENICNDLSNAHQLLSIMSSGAVEHSVWNDVDTLKGFHCEMAYALDFVADAIKAKTDALYSLIEEMEEDKEESNLVILPEEGDERK